MIEKTKTISSYGVIIIRSKVQGKRFTDIVEIGGTKYIEFAITDPGDIVFFIGIILYLYVRVKKMTKTFNSKSTRRSTNKSQPTNEHVYDERPESQAKRKIFAKDEGEYVDFEEENN
mgnify:CR=1 FL=1